MKIVKCLTVITVLCLMLQGAFAQQCTVTGEVKNRNSKNLVLHKCSESSKTMYESPVVIPIENGKFQHTFTYADIEAYELVFEDELEAGSWRPIVFFPDADVTFTLYPQKDADNNEVKGGVLTSEYSTLQARSKDLFNAKLSQMVKIRQVLQKEGTFESEEYNAVLKQLRATKPEDQEALLPIYQKMDEMEKTQTRYTERGKTLVMDRMDSLKKAMSSWRYEYIRSNPSLMSYYLMFKDVVMEVKNDPHIARLVVEAFPLFEMKYPLHVYTGKIQSQLTGVRTIVPGNKYIDFKAPTLSGDTLRLSALIKNKIALIDLWGSWCGPCIVKSRQLVPIYQKYKSKGFEVVGIAREFKTTDAVKRRLAKEQFLWTNLVELDDQQNIWSQYGISNGAGIMVLVDREGTILYVDPKPEEIERILQEKL